jgi:hypothetical protein
MVLVGSGVGGMSDKTPYQVLGIREDASFEEIQAAKEALLRSLAHSQEEQEQVEQAYDMILMQRLRLRQEGKIPVPDRIRYAERAFEAEPEQPPALVRSRVSLPRWAKNFLDTPSTQDLVWPGVILLCLIVWAALYPVSDTGPSLQLQLALAFMASIYFLFRKERRLFRSILLALLGMVGGWIVAAALLAVVGGPQYPEVLQLFMTFVVMWAVTAFLR